MSAEATAVAALVCRAAALAASFTLGLLALASGASAREGELTGTLKGINDRGAVTIGYRESSIPFSFLNEARRPVGYAIDICLEIVDDIARELGRSDLGVKYKPVTSENRLQAVAAGEIDLECGSTTANLERRQTVDFSPIDYISATKLLVKRDSPIRSYRDLGGKKVAVTTGTTNADAMLALFKRLKMSAELLQGRDHADSFQMVKDGRADALALDDVLLYGLVAAAGAEGAGYKVLPEDLSYEPYGIAFAKNDPAFSAVVTATFNRLAQTREIRWIYEKWFIKRLANGQRLNIPMSEQLTGLFQMMGLPD